MYKRREQHNISLFQVVYLQQAINSKMSCVPQDLVQKRVAEILHERENAKLYAEQARIQAEIDAAARRQIIEAELVKKRHLEEERRIQAEIERAAIAAIVEMKREDIRKKQDEIEFYRQEIIRTQTDINKINTEIASYNYRPSSPKFSQLNEDDDEDYIVGEFAMNELGDPIPTKRRTWKGTEYEVDNSNWVVSKINSLNDSLTAIITVIRNNGKLTLHKLKEIVSRDDTIAKAVRGDINDMPLSKIIQNNMKTLVEMEVLKPHN